jgi:RimJ/RimL family protein N-acetyltransferase
MKHELSIDGYVYRLRPVSLTDATFIVETRLEDGERNKFIHPISPDILLQQVWIEKYYTIPNDYYFVVENKLEKKPEGLIAIYNIIDNNAEWGRWVIKKVSLAATESFYLICRIAFEQLNLEEIYSRTIEDNKTVVAFHDSMNVKRRGVIPQCFIINNRVYNAIEHIVSKSHFVDTIQPKLEGVLRLMYERNLKKNQSTDNQIIPPPPPPYTTIKNNFEFHHIGVACYDIEKEFNNYEILGYRKEGSSFADHLQGVKGQFITAAGHPRIELLQNLENSHILDGWLTHNIKIYHIAYYVQNFDKTIEVLQNFRAKIMVPAKESRYFGKRICFLVLHNMVMIELIDIRPQKCYRELE